MKIIIGSFLIFNITCFADADLQIFDINGHRIKEVGIGVPFLLKLNIDRYANDTKEPTIEGLKSEKIKVDYQGTASTIQNINGHVTVDRTFTYKLRIDEEGEFALGPAILRVQGGNVESNKVKIKVGKTPILEKLQHERKAEKEYSLELIPEQQEYYVGQKISFKMIAKLKQGQQLVDISDLEPKNYTVYRLSKPIESKEDDFFVFAWIYEIFPNKEGTLIIPAVSATINIPAKNSFFSFFNSYDSHKVLSNSLTYRILPLPEQHKINAVGNFTKFSASIDKKEVPLGEGFIYKLILQGDGNFAEIKIDSLVGLPTEIRSFKSNTSSTQIENGDQKTFEFILQGLKEGEYEIPLQQFSFFDPLLKKYKVLKTKLIKVSIKAGSLSLGIIQSESNDTIIQNGYCEIDFSKKRFDFGFKNYLFFVLLLLPVILSLIFKLINLLTYNLKLRYFIICYGINNNNSKEIYNNILNFVALKFNKKVQDIDYEFLLNLFKNDNSWQEFLNMLLKSNFGKDVQSYHKMIFKEAKFWLKKIKDL